MKRINLDRSERRKLRHLKILRKFREIDSSLPRLIVNKSNSHFYVQLIESEKGNVIISSSTIQLKLPNNNINNVKRVGEDISKKMIKKNINQISFDRNGYKYHGKVAVVADIIRNAGIKI
ncbi:MAG: 50S ribosomal protein L18 [Mycoplasmoidaceae bacterium]